PLDSCLRDKIGRCCNNRNKRNNRNYRICWKNTFEPHFREGRCQTEWRFSPVRRRSAQAVATPPARSTTRPTTAHIAEGSWTVSHAAKQRIGRRCTTPSP